MDYRESNLNAPGGGDGTTTALDQDDRRTLARAAGEIARLRAENEALRTRLALTLDRAIPVRESDDWEGPALFWRIDLSGAEYGFAREGLKSEKRS